MSGLDLGGGVRLDAVLDGYARMTAQEAFGDRAASVLAAHPEAFDTDGGFEFPVGGYLLRGHDRITLVDAGAGPRDSWVRSGSLLENLAALGVAPDDVDDVVCTHLHWDHIGWLSQQGQAVFTRATHHCHQADWDHFYGHHPGATKRLTPVADRMRTWSRDQTLLPGVDVLHAPGHTPGSSVVVVSGSAAQVGLLGDVAHFPFQLVDPDRGFTSDVDPGLARRTRELAGHALRVRGARAAAAHFPQMGLD